MFCSKLNNDDGRQWSRQHYQRPREMPPMGNPDRYTGHYSSGPPGFQPVYPGDRYSPGDWRAERDFRRDFDRRHTSNS